METVIFDGKALASELEKSLQQRVEDLKNNEIHPKLVWVCVGNDEASLLYGRLKSQAADRLGIVFDSVVLPESISVEDLKLWIGSCGARSEVHGLLVQLPVSLEEGISPSQLVKVLDSIPVEKDVDCLTSSNLGKIVLGEPLFLPATVRGIGRVLLATTGNGFEWNEELLSSYFAGKRVGVIGGAVEVGRPLVNWLSNLGASVLWMRSTESNLQELCLMSDIVISGVGKPGLVTGEMVKEGIVIIDVGAPQGDVDFEQVKEQASFITPVPGGVGPLTVVSLMENVVEAAERVQEIRQ